MTVRLLAAAAGLVPSTSCGGGPPPSQLPPPPASAPTAAPVQRPAPPSEAPAERPPASRRPGSRDALQVAPQVQPERMLLLWGGAEADGAPILNPAFLFDGRPSLPEERGDWSVRGDAADGSRLFELDFRMAELADGAGQGAFIFALPVQPGWAGRLSRITLSGPGGKTAAVGGGVTNAGMAMLVDPDTGSIRGFLRDLTDEEAEALAKGDPNALAARNVDPSFDVVVSRGVPDPADWRR